MIPEQYWQILKRWFWIIGLVGIAGGAAGLFLLPIGLGSGASVYDSSMTLGVSRFVSFGGTVTAGSGAGNVALLADYTTSIAGMSKTAQFQARLRAALQERGVNISETALPQKVNVTADRGLFRVNIQATANSAEEAEILAEEAADALIAQVVAEEDRIKEGLAANTGEQRTELLNRLTDLNQQRLQKLDELGASALRTALDNLLRQGGVGNDLDEEFRAILEDLALIAGDAELVAINSRADALEKQLADLARTEETFSVDLLKYGEPVFVLNPVETVDTQPEGTLRGRDMLVLGGGAGLIMGWLAANMAEHVRNGRGTRREADEG